LGAVSLSSLQPVAMGGGRLVFFHPDFPDCLLKVQKVKTPGTVKERIDGLVGRRFASFATRDLRHEIKAYVDARLRKGQAEGSFPVAEFRGLVETDLGIGLLVERIFRDGELIGPTVRKLAGKEKTLSDRHLALLNEFSRQLFAWKVRARDLNPGNIVLGDRDGRERFFLVDGLGDVTLVPLNTWFDAANGIELNRLFTISARGLRLKWDRNARAFSRP
jgi:hypothetical protein